MKTIALTGGIGSGKTTVCNIFATLNIPIISADQIAADLVIINSSAYKQILKHFGADIIDTNTKQINKPKLANIIFNQPEQKKWLENLLHPLVKQIIFVEIEKLAATKIYPYCIIEIPLLFETGMEQDFDRTVVITCTPELQIARAIKRDGSNQKQVARILTSQCSNHTTRLAVLTVIENNGDINELTARITNLHKLWYNNR